MKKEIESERDGFTEQGKSSEIPMRIVSSLDGSYAISDSLKTILQQTRKSLLIATPYIGKNFVDMVRSYVSDGVEIKLLTRTPLEGDTSHTTLETLYEDANSSRYKWNIMCHPDLHAKFMIADGSVVCSGSVNLTGSGIYYNGEILYIWEQPKIVEQHISMFNRLWMNVRNTRWENFQHYTGHRGYANNYSVRRRIAELTIQYFITNRNQMAQKSLLAKHIEGYGFDESNVIETLKKLLEDGILYEPALDKLKLANYQTNIKDFNQ